MNRKLIYFAYILLLSTASFSNTLLSLDPGISFNIDDNPVYSPELGLSGSFDTYKFLNKDWSLFSNGYGDLSYLPIENLWLFDVDIVGDVSFRKNNRLFRFSSYGNYEGSSLSPLTSINVSPELYSSIDFMKATIYTTHRLSFDLLNQKYTSYAGDVGTSFLISPNIIFEPKIEWEITDTVEGVEYYIDGVLEYSWYPGIPFVLDGNIGFKQLFSDDPYIEFHLYDELTISLGETSLLLISLPFKIQYYKELSETYLIFQPRITWNLYMFEDILLSVTVESYIENSLIQTYWQ